MEDQNFYINNVDWFLNLPIDDEKEDDEILKQYQIPIEGFYNYYSVPWDENLYIKFPTNKIVIEQKGTKVGFGSSFKDTDSNTDNKLGRFMKENYLGSARETDTHHLKYIVGERTELKQ